MTSSDDRLGWDTVRRGAVAGIVGTVTMTVPILVARRVGLLATPPPVEISANVAQRLPLLPRPGQSGFPVVWVGGHLAYGAACGAVFAVGRRRLPVDPLPAGLLFGGAVWATSYLGVVPALGLYPDPGEDSRRRLLVMVVAHAVFGVTVALTIRRQGSDVRG